MKRKNQVTEDPVKSLEARGGIEPPNKGFADLCLTTWLPRLRWDESLRGSRTIAQSFYRSMGCTGNSGQVVAMPFSAHKRQMADESAERRLERETGFEPATSTLARSHST